MVVPDGGSRDTKALSDQDSDAFEDPVIVSLQVEPALEGGVTPLVSWGYSCRQMTFASRNQ
ncbi:hypothetical protein GCM10010404_15100 [Nonomuraea africana]